MTRPAVVEIVGELDLSTVVQWEAEVARAAASSHAVVLDLTGVDFVDSAGVHGLFRMVAALHGEEKQLTVVAPHAGRVRRLLEILDVPALAWVCETREQALAGKPAA